jgi:hypothetical protein
MRLTARSSAYEAFLLCRNLMTNGLNWTRVAIVGQNGSVFWMAARQRPDIDSLTDGFRSGMMNDLKAPGFKMEPAVGIEPTTDGLQNRCSAAELSWPKVRAHCTTFAR